MSQSLPDLLDAGYEQIFARDLDAARKTLDQARRAFPNEPDVALLEVDLLVEAGEGEQAVAAAEEARSRFQGDMIVSFKLATLLLDIFDDVIEARTILEDLNTRLEKGDAPNAVVICSNSAQMTNFGDDPFVEAMLAHDEETACKIIDEQDSPILAYMGSKNAVGRAVRRRAEAWGNAGVRLNAVCPGPVNTPLLQGTIERRMDSTCPLTNPTSSPSCRCPISTSVRPSRSRRRALT